MSNLIPITRIYDIYPKYTYSNDVKKFMDEIVDIDRVNVFTKADMVDILDKIIAAIVEEKDYAYADFEQYKVDYLGVDAEYVEDELPQDDFRYGMERAVEIIDKYKSEREVV